MVRRKNDTNSLIARSTSFSFVHIVKYHHNEPERSRIVPHRHLAAMQTATILPSLLLYTNHFRRCMPGHKRNAPREFLKEISLAVFFSLSTPPLRGRSQNVTPQQFCGAPRSSPCSLPPRLSYPKLTPTNQIFETDRELLSSSIHR